MVDLYQRIDWNGLVRTGVFIDEDQVSYSLSQLNQILMKMLILNSYIFSLRSFSRLIILSKSLLNHHRFSETLFAFILSSL